MVIFPGDGKKRADQDNTANKLKYKNEDTMHSLFNSLNGSLCLFASTIVKSTTKAQDIVLNVFEEFRKQDVSGLTTMVAVEQFLYGSTKEACLEYLNMQGRLRVNK